MNKKIVLIMMLFLVSFATANITVLEYSASEDQSDILYKMNKSMDDLEKLGYDNKRLKDIYDEAGKVTDSYIFYNFASNFRESTILAHNAIKDYNELKIEMSILEKHNLSVNSINNSLNEAEENIRQGRYEDAQTYLDIAEKRIDDNSNMLFRRALDKIELLKTKGEDLDNSYLEDIKRRALVARDLQDLVSLDNLFDEINEAETTLQFIEKIDLYIEAFQKWGIKTKRLEDIRTQIIFLYENGRFDDVSSLYDQAEEIHSTSLEFQIKYRDTRKEMEKTGVERFNTTLQLAHQNYLEGDFGTAFQQLSELNEDIIDYQSSRFALDNIRSNTVDLWNLIGENWQYVVGSLAILVVIGVLVSKGIKKGVMKKRVENLKEEKQNLERLMREIQEQYYVKHEVSKKAYEQKFKQYQKRFVEITKELDILDETISK